MTDLTIYAAGEIHSDWRDEFRAHLARHDVEAEVLGPRSVSEQWGAASRRGLRCVQGRRDDES